MPLFGMSNTCCHCWINFQTCILDRVSTDRTTSKLTFAYPRKRRFNLAQIQQSTSFGFLGHRLILQHVHSAQSPHTLLIELHNIAGTFGLFPHAFEFLPQLF